EVPATSSAADAEEELEQQFDHIAAEAAASQSAPEPAREEDREALFDQIAAERAAGDEAVDVAPEIDPAADAAVAAVDEAIEHHTYAEPPPPQEVFQRIGALTRNLHDALHELGYDKAVEDAVSSLPDARDRLSYIADLTGKAAERALTAVEQGQQYQNEVRSEASRLAAQWERVFNGELELEEFKHTAVETRGFLKSLDDHTARTNEQFT